MKDYDWHKQHLYYLIGLGFMTLAYAETIESFIMDKLNRMDSIIYVSLCSMFFINILVFMIIFVRIVLKYLKVIKEDKEHKKNQEEKLKKFK